MIKNGALTAVSAELHNWRSGDTIYVTTEICSLIDKILDAIGYQLPIKVTEYTEYATGMEGIFDSYELCPKCGLPLERTYQQYCDKCGQSLQWGSKKIMTQKYR